MARQQERSPTGQWDLAGRGTRVEQSGAGEETRYAINGANFRRCCYSKIHGVPPLLSLENSSDDLLRSNCGQTAARTVVCRYRLKEKPRICRAFRSALGRTRTCDLLIRSLNWQVLLGSSLLANSLHSGRKRGFARCGFSILFGSVLSLLLPHCCQEIYIGSSGSNGVALGCKTGTS